LTRAIRATLLALLLAALAPGALHAQGRGNGPAPTARAAAAQDLTGYWVSVVAEHWHLRMRVPPKGEFAMLPLNPEARRLASAWDPASAAASAEPCRAYGAAAIMRVPGRLNIHWADDNTLQMDIDSGTQTRRFRFTGAAPASHTPDWQGYSVAAWEPQGRGSSARHLKVTTTRMRPGLLRRNGVPYSGNATLQEYFDRFTEPNGDEWLVVDSILTDPDYLTQPYITSTAFKKIPARSGWDPTPCRADRPR
jgi:hypothetical protein